MRTPRRGPIALAVLAAALLPGGRVASAATATALVSATVLGPAGEETASGAVTVSRISGDGAAVVLPRLGRGASASTLARFRVGGGVSASFAVALPASAVVRGETGELEVTDFRVTGDGSLGGDGTAVVSVGAEVHVPAGQAPGRYAGSYPVTIAYD